MAYARFEEGGAWRYVGFEEPATGVEAVSLGVGEDGAALISYVVWEDGETVREPGRGAIRVLEVESDLTLSPSTVVEVDDWTELTGGLSTTQTLVVEGRPVVLYSGAGREVMEATRSVDGVWASTLVHDGPTPYGCTAAVDRSGVMHLAMYVPSQRSILVGSRERGGWSFEEISAAGSAESPHSTGPSIAIAADGTVHLAYVVLQDDDLWHSHRNPSAGWHHERVAEGDISSARMVVDGDGAPQLSFTNCHCGDCDPYRAVRRPSS